jgi:hypothetical protein
LEKAVESLEQQKQEAVDMCFYTMDNIDDGYQRQGKFNDQTMRMLLRRCVQAASRSYPPRMRLGYSPIQSYRYTVTV